MLCSRDVTRNTAMTFIEVLAERCHPPFDRMEARDKVERAYSRNQNSQAENILEKVKWGREAV